MTKKPNLALVQAENLFAHKLSLVQAENLFAHKLSLVQAENLFAHKLSLVRADGFFRRLLGLIGQRTIEPSHALLLKPCSGVHTFGLRFSIGVFFIDKHGVIVKTIAQLKPNRIALCWQARSVVETAAFKSDRTEAMTSAVLRVLVQD